jgi:protein gp37
MTNVEWADKSRNFVIGCKEVSAGCDLCYARTMHNRNLHNPTQPNYTDGFNMVKELPNRLEIPWKKPYKIFVNSMSDTFNKDVSDNFIQKMFNLFNKHPQHIYQILTKRPGRMLKMDKSGMLKLHDNIWFGTSVELAKHYGRINLLRKTSAAVKWLSLEPLLGPMDEIDLTGIDLVIVGGESDQPKIDRPTHRKPIKMEYEWVDPILKKCRELGIVFFYKQSGVLQPCIGDHEGDKCKGIKGCKYFRGKKYQSLEKIE